MSHEEETRAVAHIVEAMKNGSWNDKNSSYVLFGGWCAGGMSPMNRCAFLAKFGAEKTLELEQKAADEISSRMGFWENSEGKKHLDEAHANAKADARTIKSGNFILAKMMHLKAGGTLYETMLDCVSSPHCFDEETRLCKITRIVEVDSISACRGGTALDFKSIGEEGGSATDDDVGDIGDMLQNYRFLDEEKKRTFYTLTAMVRDKAGKWFLIDYEGYDYVRYVLMPERWREMYGDAVAEAEGEIDARRKAKQKKIEDERAARKAVYDALCRKWEGVMAQLPEKGTCDYAEYMDAVKRNIVAMAKHVFPDTSFTVSSSSSWGEGMVLSWKNGPTKEEMEEKTDMDLFMGSWDEFDGMTDCSSTGRAEFASFAQRFGNVRNGISFRRKVVEEKPRKASKPRKADADAKGVAVAVAKNAAKKGVEIRFNAVPSEDLRSELKAKGWRWSRFAGVWYNRDTDENYAFALAIAERVNGKTDAA